MGRTGLVTEDKVSKINSGTFPSTQSTVNSTQLISNPFILKVAIFDMIQCIINHYIIP